MKPSHSIQIDGWDVTDGNLEELAQHGLPIEIVDQVAENEPRFRRNKKGRPASHQMIGPDGWGQDLDRMHGRNGAEVVEANYWLGGCRP